MKGFTGIKEINHNKNNNNNNFSILRNADASVPAFKNMALIKMKLF